jgi:spermidine synthase
MTEERVEHLLAEVQDEFGVIRVLEVADYRFLEFGDAIEQSCVFTADPSWLEYDYTRAMLIGALCHEQPESALFLGLGAGTLTQAAGRCRSHRAAPGCAAPGDRIPGAGR